MRIVHTDKPNDGTDITDLTHNKKEAAPATTNSSKDNKRDRGERKTVTKQSKTGPRSKGNNTGNGTDQQGEVASQDVSMSEGDVSEVDTHMQDTAGKDNEDATPQPRSWENDRSIEREVERTRGQLSNLGIQEKDRRLLLAMALANERLPFGGIQQVEEMLGIKG